MDRYDYLSGYQKPPLIYDQVKFLIPGSGGSFIGVAEVRNNFALKSYGSIGVNGFRHYENIHYNHINWGKPAAAWTGGTEGMPAEITWQGEHVGYVLETRPAGYTIQPTSDYEEMLRKSVDELNQRYPGAK
jgi:hypothetical protein